MYDHEKSDPAIVAVKPTNKSTETTSTMFQRRASHLLWTGS